jgi:hypothetical protein
MKIYIEHETKIKKIAGDPSWEYAMSMGKLDETFMAVPIVENGKVVNTLVCARFDKKVYFRYENSEENNKFFNEIISGKEFRVSVTSDSSKNTVQKGIICVSQSVSVWHPNDENNPWPGQGGGHWETSYYNNCYSYQDYSNPDMGGSGGDNGGFDYGGGSGGSTVDPNNPQNLTPCEKTKSTYNNTAVKSRYEVLKPKTAGPGESGFGFKTVPDGSGGTTTQTTPLNPDSTDPDKMHVGIYPTSYGFIHTHLDKPEGSLAIKIFSPADINTFLNFIHNAVANGIPLGEIFGGMIASDPDTGYNIYQMQYVGNGNDLPPVFTKAQMELLKSDYTKIAQEMVTENGGSITHSDMQRLFLKTLNQMNLQNIILTKIEGDNIVKTINYNSQGSPSEDNCL